MNLFINAVAIHCLMRACFGKGYSKEYVDRAMVRSSAYGWGL